MFGAKSEIASGRELYTVGGMRPVEEFAICASRIRSNLSQDRIEDRVVDDDAFICTEESLRSVLATPLVPGPDDRPFDVVAHDRCKTRHDEERRDSIRP